MNDLINQLHDIEGIDAIAWWPLAPGWWGIISLVLISVVLLGVYIQRRRRLARSWQQDVASQLCEMEQKLTPTTAVATAKELSEIIRRIAIQQFSRKQCAALEGKAWLRWLKNHDPNQFDWQTQGEWLITVVYAPSTTSIPIEHLRNCLAAIKRWIQ
ncbi:MAG: DUF4381 domain-containing protein [Pseudomonadota bacterium]